MQSNLAGSLELANDPFEVITCSNLLANFLFNSGLITNTHRDQFYSALFELLINSIEHGNCQITFQEKHDFLQQGKDIMDLIRHKNQDPAVSRRKVNLAYKITPSNSLFRIRDDGPGFDWKSFQGRKADPDDLHGRGLMMAKSYLENLSYNEKGNEVSFTLSHENLETNVVPTAFTNQEEVVFEDGAEVFRQGEESSHLYYIISGKFDVFANDKKFSTLTAADIFLGEMSFLLNNKRSATVKAVGRGVTLRISKEAFINAIKEHPHYGIFLARLLAQRLVLVHDVSV
jgi:hypothetical protein